MENLVIIGSGPAGISAALYAARAGLSPVVLTQGPGALGKAGQIDNYYGAPLTGPALHAAGEEQARALGVRILETQAVGVVGFDTYTVRAVSGDFDTIAVLLATGAKRATPTIPGLKELEGAGVSYCAVCDAFFYRGKPVAVLGSGDFALHEADELAPLAGSVTILTNGEPEAFTKPCPYPIDRRPISALVGDKALAGVQFADGGLLLANGLFVALGTAGSAEIARQTGAELGADGSVVVDAAMQTTLPGLYAAGDCTGGLKQIAKAVHEGTQAGLSAIQYIRDYRKTHPNL